MGLFAFRLPFSAYSLNLGFDLNQRGFEGGTPDGIGRLLRKDVFALQTQCLFFPLPRCAPMLGCAPILIAHLAIIGIPPHRRGLAPGFSKAFAICSSTDLLSHPRAISSFYEGFVWPRPAE